MDNVAEAGVIVLLALLLYVAVQYSDLRARYADVYAWYARVTTQAPHTPINIGPTRVVLCYERPALASVLLSRPVSQQAADFIIRLVRVKRVSPLYLFYGPGANDADSQRLDAFTKTKAAWDSAANPLSEAGGGHIPFGSPLVAGYQGRSGASDLSLLILWLYGYEEYVRQRFTQSATSVLAEWDFMFAAAASPPATAKDSTCAAGSMISALVSAGVGGAGVGAMMGSPAGGVGAVPGAVGGFFVGVLGALAGRTRCL